MSLMTEHGGELPTCSLVHYKLYFSVQIKSSGLKGIIIIIIIITTTITITTTTINHKCSVLENHSRIGKWIKD